MGLFVYLEVDPAAMGHVTRLIDMGSEVVGVDWREYVDEETYDSRLTHAIIAGAANEVFEVVRLPFALVTIPLLFRKRKPK